MSNLIATNRKTVLVGLGLTGLSVARYLSSIDRHFSVFDSRELPPNLESFKKEFPAVSCLCGPIEDDALVGVDEIILSPGVSRKAPFIQNALDAGVSVIGDIELFARECKAPVVAITGSNGKSTVTTLLGEMAERAGLKVRVGGNLGFPALDLLEDEAELYVLELSSFQLESTESLKPAVATILNVTPDHMDRYDSLMAYHQAKQRVYFNAKNIVVNRADMLTQAPLGAQTSMTSFGLDKPDLNSFGLINDEGKSYLARGLEKLVAADELKIRGEHNLLNALAALALGYAIKLPKAAMLDALRAFKGLAHRCEYVASINGVTFYNDSKATNVGATAAALRGMGSGLIVILGGDGKGADFSALKAPLNDGVKAVVSIGRDGKKITALAGEAEAIEADSMVDAVNAAYRLAHAGDTVLLSPACASFDMFESYEDRGEQFKAAVEALC